MFYIVGNKRCMNARTTRVEAYKNVKKTKTPLEISKATATGTKKVGKMMISGDTVYFVPVKGKAYIVNKDGSIGAEYITKKDTGMHPFGL